MFGNSSENDFLNNNHSQVAQAANQIAKAQSTFMAKVYGWMFSGLSITGITAYFVYESGLVYELGGSIFLLFIALFGMVWYLSSRIDTMSASTASILFIAYSFIQGVVLSTLFARYTMGSISTVFFISAGSFGALSAFGLITKKDLTGVGNFMFMGLIGIILASIVNVFLGSSILYTTISVLGVLIFAGLTAYDTQKIKEMYLSAAESREVATKTSIIAALSLYLDFINLFIFLLRLLGDRR